MELTDQVSLFNLVGFVLEAGQSFGWENQCVSFFIFLENQSVTVGVGSVLLEPKGFTEKADISDVCTSM